jgi:hypothetical protein
MTSTSQRIRELNDEFRLLGPLFGRSKFNGLWLISCGLQELAPTSVTEAVLAVQHHSNFSKDNDPHGEHDFGSFFILNQRCFWKIDYLERGTNQGAEDPADNARTCRVLTIMLAEEY